MIDVTASHPLGMLRFESVRVLKTQLLGNPDEGFRIAMDTLDVFRTTVGAAAQSNPGSSALTSARWENSHAPH